jgi:hypothetical protein
MLVSAVLFLCLTASGSAKVSGADKLAKGCHPRLIMDETEFRQLKKMVGGDDVVSKLHKHLIEVAGTSVADEERYTSVRRPNGKSTACPILTRLVSCAYAYKMTGLEMYLDKAISDLNDVCSFDGWYVRSYLDVAQVSAAVSIAYDWLYDSLPKSVRTKVVHALKTFALETSRMSDRHEYTWWYKRIGNWNQVCNAGLVCAALAVYEHCPALAQEVIDDAIRTNKVAVEGIYGPDGAYPEGTTYWHFGNIYQVLMLSLLDDIFSTDFGISSAPGFMDTGLYRMFACGSNGWQFNYADNVLSTDFNYPLYYFAYKRNEPSMLYNEIRLLKKPEYSKADHCAFLILAIKYAMRMDLSSLSAPTEKFYSAQGNVPVMMCRSGWGKRDHYLGIKGGKDAELHGHMDGGTFVYYADRVRWALDLKREAYYKLRPGLKELGGSIADYSQNSLRWKLFRYNCRQHNTLTVNDKDHDVTAFVHMTATENTSGRMSATFDLTPLFDGDLVKAERTAALCEESYVEIKDVLKAPADRPANVRWTMVTAAQPEITPDGILLTKGSASKKLSTSGGNVTYRMWSSNIEDYADVLRVEGKPIEAPVSKNTYICGYEVDIPAGEEFTLITTLK